MRVGLNATCLNERPSGSKQRFQALYGALFERLPEVEFHIFEPFDCRVADWFPYRPNVFGRQTPVPSLSRAGKFIKGYDHWRSVFGAEKFDFFEAMHLPLFRPQHGKTILTVHDIRGVGKENSLIHRSVFSTVLRDALNRADHVVTVSNAMRSEILEFFPNVAVSVIYNCFNSSLIAGVSDRNLTGFTAKYHLPREYILAVGHLEKRKNYLRLIEAVARLKCGGLNFSLVIVGKDSGDAVSVRALIRKLDLQDQVILLSELSDYEVWCAYRCCSLFVFPSLYEGFGIPVLEAMAAGKPMALSNSPIFREISGGQGLYFDPECVESISNAIEIGMTDSKLRQFMIDYGYGRVMDFDCEKAAGELVRVYQSLAE